MNKKIYIASRRKDGGIYEYTFTGNKYENTGFAPADQPMHMIISNDKMHILLRAPFENSSDSGLISYTVDEDGKLTNPSEIMSTKGECACHLSMIDGSIWCVNYASGSVIKMPDKLSVHKGSCTSHTHFAGQTPDKKYVCVTDLGLDKIYIYDTHMNNINTVAMPSGHGVRHMVFDSSGKYVFTANELASTVSALRYSDGSFELIHTVSSIPCPQKSAPSAIRIYKGHIYTANRFHDSISKLSFDGSKLKLVDSFSCGGNIPRDFIFHENRLVCANQKSNTVTVFKENDSEKFDFIQKIKINEPMCIIEKGF